VVFLLILRKGPAFYPPHLLYYLNYDHAHLTEFTGHFWSLCVEVQFYLLTAFGSVAGGGNAATMYQMLTLGGVDSGAPTIDTTVGKYIPIAASAIIQAPATGPAQAAWRAYISGAATGLLVAEGSTLSVGRIG